LSASRRLDAYEIPQRKLTKDELFHLDNKFEALGNGLTYAMAIEECEGLAELHNSCFKILRSKRGYDK